MESKPRRVLLGITGGVAAYKAAELTRLMIRGSMDVRVVMTQSATRLIAPATLQALSGQPVHTELWDDAIPDGMGHIELSRDRDLIVVAPATADFLAKIANGNADDLLSTLCIARDCPLLVAPAMNRQMWDHPATQRKVQQLLADGVGIVGPAAGEQACGEVGLGRMAEPADIIQEIGVRLQPKTLADVRVLITAGPTFEPIDAVRGITNRSSGRMGYAVAQAAIEAGAQVTLISGPTAIASPAGAHKVDVLTAQEMLDAVNRYVDACEVFISVAAVADYRVSHPSKQKMKKQDATLTLELEPTVDILATVAARPKPPFCVGFAAESHDLDRFAEEKRRRKKLPLLAANLAQHAIGAHENELVLFDDAGRHALGRGSKLEQARALIAHLARLYRGGRAVKLKAVRR
jgi:phosphopantothenoylcysteine decarboxylase/phosphopantothenate--cysteine ligase